MLSIFYLISVSSFELGKLDEQQISIEILAIQLLARLVYVHVLNSKLLFCFFFVTGEGDWIRDEGGRGGGDRSFPSAETDDHSNQAVQV